MPIPKRNPRIAALRQQAKNIHSNYREAVNRGLVSDRIVLAIGKAQKKGYNPSFRTKRLIVEAWLKNRRWSKDKNKELPITIDAMLRAAERVPGSHSRIFKQFTPASLRMRKDRTLLEFKRPITARRVHAIPKKWEITKSGSYITNMFLKSINRPCWVEFRLNKNGRIDESSIVNFGLVKNKKRIERFYPEKEKEAITEMIIELETQMMEEERQNEKEH
ncbi:MAG: hypothetical protein Q7R70_00750 [Candidatus Diapherotrites archaeon]|nr:hypothetical protein [Candidatus Diapherotrites archaeon]